MIPLPKHPVNFEVGDRVNIRGCEGVPDGTSGEIAGIAVQHIVTFYIVLLDNPIPPPPNFTGKPWKAVVLLGGLLVKEE